MFTKVKKLVNHYREGGVKQAASVSLRYLRKQLKKIPFLGNYVKFTKRYGVRHGIVFASLRNLFWVLPSDETGTNVFDREWDVLIVVDTCRPEWMEKVAVEYDMIDEVETIRSVGARTSEWTVRPFRKASSVDQPVVYIYGSKYGEFANEVADIDSTFVKDEHYKYPPANKITDEALEQIESKPEDCRFVIHYAQPHFPVFRRNGSRTDIEVVNATTRGAKSAAVESGGDYQTVEDLFVSNLRYVMDEVSILVNERNNSQVALTADHGQYVGEYFFVGHPPGGRGETVRNVPWVQIDGKSR